MSKAALRDNDDTIVAYGFLVSEDEQRGTITNSFVQLFYSALDVRRVMACSAPDTQVLICDHTFEVSPLNLAAALHKDCPFRDIYLQKTEPQGLFISRVEAAGARGVVSLSEAKELVGLPAAEPIIPSLSGEEDDSMSGGFFIADEQLAPEQEDYCFLVEDEFSPRITQQTHTEKAHADATTKSFPPSITQQPHIEKAHAEETTESFAAVSPADLSWLEEVLELEYIDDIPSATSPAIVERIHTLPVPVGTYKEPDSKVASSALPQQGEGGTVAAFISGRGGVGKSSLTILAAFDLWRKGLKVALLDMDLQFGDLSTLAGNEPQSKIQRLSIEQLCTHRVMLPAIDDALLLIESARNPELAEELIPTIPSLLAALREVADVVLINTSCLWNEAAAILACCVDRLVVCMDQRATSVSAARQVVDLCIRLQIPSTQLYYLLNRCSRIAPLTDIDASLAMGGAKVMTIADGGSDVDELLSLGCPLELLSAQTQLRLSIQELGVRLSAEPGTLFPPVSRSFGR